MSTWVDQDDDDLVGAGNLRALRTWAEGLSLLMLFLLCLAVAGWVAPVVPR